MADDRSEVIRRGKSEHHTAACRVKHAGGVRPSERRRKVSQKRHRRFFGNEVQVRLKRRGKSSPLAEQSARQEKPHAVQDKTEGGPPVRTPRILSGLILGYRRITRSGAAVYDGRTGSRAAHASELR